MTDPTPDSALQVYGLGYRDGFHHGYAEAGVQAKRADRAERPSPEGEAKGNDNGDGKGDDSKGDDSKSPDSKGDAKQGDGGTSESHDDSDKRPLYRRPLLVGAVLLVLIGALIGGIVFWRHSRHHEKTDDAFVDGHASAIAAQAGGRVVKLLVEDNQRVNAGDLLLEIDPRDVDARVAEATAQVATAEARLDTARAQIEVRRATAAQAAAAVRQDEAQLAKAEQDLARYRAVDPAAVARQQADSAATAARSARAALDAARSTERSMRSQALAAEAEARSAEAGVQAARATLSAGELQRSYTHVVAPTAGHVTRRQVEVGNVVNPGQPLLSIVGEALWVTANFKETQLARMQPGQAVAITVDAYPDAHFRAHVDSIQRGTGSYFSLLPAENATGNYVKVVQRVPVKIVFDEDPTRQYPIGPGLSVTPDVEIP